MNASTEKSFTANVIDDMRFFQRLLNLVWLKYKSQILSRIKYVFPGAKP